MPTLGDLERRIMDALWSEGSAQSAYDLVDRLAAASHSSARLAPTTVLTVLSRLEHKGFVVRERAMRPHRYRALASREEHVAELLHEVLNDASDRTAVLARFLGGVRPEEAVELRRMLDGDPS